MRRYATALETTSRLDEIFLHRHRAWSHRLVEFCNEMKVNTKIKRQIEKISKIYLFFTTHDEFTDNTELVKTLRHGFKKLRGKFE